LEKKDLKLFKIAMPIFFEILLFMLLGLADTLMLSRFGTMEQSQIAVDAVGMSNQLIGNVNIFFGFISVGTGVLIAQNIGAGNRHEVKRVTIISLGVNLIVGILFSCLLVFYGRDILDALGLRGNRLEEAATYIRFVGGFMTAQALMTTMTAVIRNHGETHVTLKITIGMNVLNVIGDAVFIFGLFGAPALGVKGVAIATSVSRFLAFVVMTLHIFNKYVKFRDFRFFREAPLKEVKQVLSIGVPSALENMSYNLQQMTLAWIVLNYMSDVSYTTRIFVWQISWFVLLFSLSVGQATQIMIGQLAGARDFEAADRTFIHNLRVSLMVTIPLAILLLIFRFQLIQIYSVNPAIISLGAATLVIDALLEPGRSFTLVFLAGVKGAGDVIFPTVIGVIFMWLIGVGVSVLLGVKFGIGLPALWMGMALDEWIRGIIGYFRWKNGKWKTKVKAKQVEDSLV